MDSDLETTQPADKPRGWVAELSRDIGMAWADIPLLASCFVSGICESITLTAASVFVSMQTGPSLSLSLSLLLLLLQSALVCAAAAVAQSGAVPTIAQRSLGDQTALERLEVAARRETDPLVVVPHRAARLPILAPPRENPKRNRRVAAVVLLAAGGLCGGFLQRSGAGMGAALWVAAAVKMVIAVALLAWKGQEVPRVEKR
ncbi:hypothetical protein RB598_006349 [Gaeumannomyces tritici]